MEHRLQLPDTLSQKGQLPQPQLLADEARALGVLQEVSVKQECTSPSPT